MWKRIFAGVMTLVLILGFAPGISVPAEAKTAVFGGLGVKDTDPATVNNWKNVIPNLDTTYAGGVWTDKSVFFIGGGLLCRHR